MVVGLVSSALMAVDSKAGRLQNKAALPPALMITDLRDLEIWKT